MDTPAGPLPQPETCWREAARAEDAAARAQRRRILKELDDVGNVDEGELMG